MQLQGKTVLVTGGTDGIGGHLIRQLRGKGATVITQGRILSAVLQRAATALK